MTCKHRWDPVLNKPLYKCACCGVFATSRKCSPQATTDGEDMAKCQHRWHPSNFGIRHRPPNSYWYECQRCHKIITTLLKEKTNEPPRNQ